MVRARKHAKFWGAYTYLITNHLNVSGSRLVSKMLLITTYDIHGPCLH